VGLTPEDIGQALQFKLSSDAARVEALYKSALGKEAVARTKQLEPTMTIPGTDVKLTTKQWVDWYKTASKDERTAAVKNYEYYVAQETKAGRAPRSFQEYSEMDKTTHQKDYDAAVAGGYKGSYHEWRLELAKAGATTIGEFREKKEVGEEVKAIAAIKSPKFVSDIMKAADKQKFFLEEDPTRARDDYIIGEMERKLDASPHVKKSEPTTTPRPGWNVTFTTGETVFIGAGI